MAVAPDGRVYVYKEVNKPDLIISEASKEIIRVNGDDDIRYTYAPGDLWSRTKDSGITIQETFSKHGVRLTQVSNKRVQGWLTVKEHLAVIDTRDAITGAPIKRANLTIFNTCATLIKHIAMIQRDDKDPNDCATQPHDITHICDALRYGLASRNKNATLTEDKRLPRKKLDRYVNRMTDWG
jgi:phage terminase large subunit